jgi:cell division protein FtsB
MKDVERLKKQIALLQKELATQIREKEELEESFDKLEDEFIELRAYVNAIHLMDWQPTHRPQ